VRVLPEHALPVCVGVCLVCSFTQVLSDAGHAYDWDTKIHLLARGPGIAPGMVWKEPATQVDMAPTFLGLAGMDKPANFDGKSLVPLLVSRASADLTAHGPAATGPGMALPQSVSAHLERLLGEGRSRQTYAAGWRKSVFIEYYFVNDNNKCTENCTANAGSAGYPLADTNCGVLTPGDNDRCWGNGCR
jgi:arylsulfatase A-like enzyme